VVGQAHRPEVDLDADGTARLSPEHSLAYGDHAAVADRQQQHDRCHHALDAPKPFARLFPSLCADRFVHG